MHVPGEALLQRQGLRPEIELCDLRTTSALAIVNDTILPATDRSTIRETVSEVALSQTLALITHSPTVTRHSR